MKSGENQYTKNNHVPVSAHPSDRGKARDIVAKKVGFRSGHEVDRAVKELCSVTGNNSDGVLIR